MQIRPVAFQAGHFFLGLWFGTTKKPGLRKPTGPAAYLHSCFSQVGVNESHWASVTGVMTLTLLY